MAAKRLELGLGVAGQVDLASTVRGHLIHGCEVGSHPESPFVQTIEVENEIGELGGHAAFEVADLDDPTATARLRFMLAPSLLR